MNSETSYKDVGLGTILKMFACRPYQTIKEIRKRRLEDEIECRRIALEDPPEAAPRPRALSDVGKSPAMSQFQSRLFQLPAELRIKIYAELLSPEDDIHFYNHFYQTGDRRVKSAIFRTRKDTDTHHEKPRCMDLKQQKKWLRGDVEPANNLGLLGFVICCRQAYVETIDLLYSQPTLVFYGYYSFVAFNAAILPQRYHSIRSVYIINHIHNYDKGASWGGTTSYRTVRENDLPVRNPELQSVGCRGSAFIADHPPRVEPFKLYDWQHAFQLVFGMRGIKKFCWDTNMEPYAHWPSQTNNILAVDFWDQMKKFSEIRDWQGGFEVCVNDFAKRIPLQPLWETMNLDFVRVKITADGICG